MGTKPEDQTKFISPIGFVRGILRIIAIAFLVFGSWSLVDHPKPANAKAYASYSPNLRLPRNVVDMGAWCGTDAFAKTQESQPATTQACGGPLHAPVAKSAAAPEKKPEVEVFRIYDVSDIVDRCLSRRTILWPFEYSPEGYLSGPNELNTEEICMASISELIQGTLDWNRRCSPMVLGRMIAVQSLPPDHERIARLLATVRKVLDANP